MMAVFIGSSIWSSLPTPESVKAQRVTRAALSLPHGSTKQQVAALLHRESLNDSYISIKEGLDYDSDVRNSGYSQSKLSGYYAVMIRNTSWNFPVSGDTYYCFFFDKKKKFLKTTVKDILTGP